LVPRVTYGLKTAIGGAMTGFRDAVQWETVAGDKVTVDDITVTPQSQALVIRWPNGGFVWNRPVAVLVEREGETKRVPITDVTLVARLALFGLGLAFTILTIGLSMKRRRDGDE
jgi:hypothetical protein